MPARFQCGPPKPNFRLDSQYFSPVREWKPPWPCRIRSRDAPRQSGSPHLAFRSLHHERLGVKHRRWVRFDCNKDAYELALTTNTRTVSGNICETRYDMITERSTWSGRSSVVTWRTTQVKYRRCEKAKKKPNAMIGPRGCSRRHHQCRSETALESCGIQGTTTSGYHAMTCAHPRRLAKHGHHQPRNK